MRGTTVKRLRKEARNLSQGQPNVVYEAVPLRIYPDADDKVRYAPSVSRRMVLTCTRRQLKTLKQNWKHATNG